MVSVNMTYSSLYSFLLVPMHQHLCQFNAFVSRNKLNQPSQSINDEWPRMRGRNGLHRAGLDLDWVSQSSENLWDFVDDVRQSELGIQIDVNEREHGFEILFAWFIDGFDIEGSTFFN